MRNIKKLLAITVMLIMPLGVVIVPVGSAYAAGLSSVAALPSVPTEINCADPSNKDKCSNITTNPITQWLQYLINILGAVIGIGAVIMVAVAGLQYSAARDNPQGIQAAKQKLTNVLIGLAAFIFLYAFLQYLVPGGAF